MPQVPKQALDPGGTAGDPGLLADKGMKPSAGNVMQAIAVMNSYGRFGGQQLGDMGLPHGGKIKGGAGPGMPRRSKSPKGRGVKSLLK
jgi:hypothetical protein